MTYIKSQITSFERIIKYGITYFVEKEVIFLYIVLGSVTSATRLARAIEREMGIPAYVVHTPSAIRSGGCSYSVNVSGMNTAYDAECARRIASEQGASVKNIYNDVYRNGERVYYAVS